MRYRLAPLLYCAFIEERVVLLDVARDRYRLLAPPAARALRSAGSNAPDTDGLSRLEALGIVEQGEGRIAPPNAPRPTRSAIEADDVPDHSIGFLTVMGALSHAMLRLRCHGFERTLGQIRPMRDDHGASMARILPVAQGYLRHRARVPLHQICLPDSLALHRLLTARNLGASLVIGVRLDPFAAHCWLQRREVVLNDRCDNVAGFTPILVR